MRDLLAVTRGVRTPRYNPLNVTVVCTVTVWLLPVGRNLVQVLPTAFDTLTQLDQLDLSNNALSSLDVSVFRNLTQLTELFLYTNRFTEAGLPSGIFAPLARLEWLDLFGCAAPLPAGCHLYCPPGPHALLPPRPYAQQSVYVCASRHV